MAELDIEGMLRLTAAATRYPETPDMQWRVSEWLASPETSGRTLTLNRFALLASRALSRPGERGPELNRRVRAGIRPALAALLVALLAVAVALAMTPSREAIARLLGVQGSTIEVVPAGTIPTPVATATFVPGGGPIFPVPLGNIATPTPLEAIGASTGFEAKLPAGQSRARASFVVAMGSDRVVLLQFDDFDLWEARLEQEANFGKSIEANSIREELTVNGEPATWLSGTPHFVYYTDSRGIRIEGSMRLVEHSTLIWRTDYAFYRIETALPKDEALKIAATLP
jgi:hypothetical protein